MRPPAKARNRPNWRCGPAGSHRRRSPRRHPAPSRWLGCRSGTSQTPSMLAPRRCGVHPPAEQHLQCGEDHRLTCAGLTGQRCETRARPHTRGSDHAQVLDAQLADHGDSLAPSAPTLDRQLELLDQSVDEQGIAQPGQSHRTTAAHDLDPITGLQGINRWPSHHSTAGGESGRTSSARPVVPDTTIGRANNACADMGTSSIASTVGHTTGPPADHAYPVEPVGVANNTPSHPTRSGGGRRPPRSPGSSARRPPSRYSPR